MSAVEFGTLQDVVVREAWAHEALAFTPWLAENLDRLGEALGITLEHVDSEVAVTTFSADILARIPQDGTLVLIENQLEDSDHTHLGQIMTYLAGLETKTVIWVAPRFRDAHLSALRWMNQHTPPEFAFFAVRLRVVRIGSSPFAPLFDVVERPNTWERALQEQTRETQDRGPLTNLRREFWAYFVERFPTERANGQPPATSHFWVRVPGTPLMVSRYLAEGNVGLFIRGARGAPTATAVALLEPFSERLTSLLGCSFNESTNFLFTKSLNGSISDQSSWPALADFLHQETDRYIAALTDVFGVTN